MADYQSMIEEINGMGYDVRSVNELRMSGERYEDLVPLLMKWLKLIDDTKIKTSIVRAISFPWVRDGVDRLLIDEFINADSATELGYKWTIANALSIIAGNEVLDELIDLVRDVRHGRAREMLAFALARMKSPVVVPILVGLLDDEIAGHAIVALGDLRAKDAAVNIEPFLSHQNSWIRAEARRALRKINK